MMQTGKVDVCAYCTARPHPQHCHNGCPAVPLCACVWEGGGLLSVGIKQLHGVGDWSPLYFQLQSKLLTELAQWCQNLLYTLF